MLEETGIRVKKASAALAAATSAEKNEMLRAMARSLTENAGSILEANKKDIENGRKNGMNDAFADRLLLTRERIESMAKGIEDVIALPDPVGKILWETTRENGLKIQRISVPIGVIGIIYEARPNVTSDAAALAVKAGNAVILRGGKEAFLSNACITDSMRKGLENAGFDPDITELVRDTSRGSSLEMMRMNKYIDALIPRGSASLINAVVENSSVPVIETGAGN